MSLLITVYTLSYHLYVQISRDVNFTNFMDNNSTIVKFSPFKLYSYVLSEMYM